MWSVLLPLQLNLPAPTPAEIAGTTTVHSSASLVVDVRSADFAAFSESASVTKLPGETRRLATAEDYEVVSVPLVVGTAVFSVLVAAVDVETGAIWGVAAIAMTALAMRERAFAATISWLADNLTPPKE
jgi:hypothetical protein